MSKQERFKLYNQMNASLAQARALTLAARGNSFDELNSNIKDDYFDAIDGLLMRSQELQSQMK